LLAIPGYFRSSVNDGGTCCDQHRAVDDMAPIMPRVYSLLITSKRNNRHAPSSCLKICPK
jgi:hypothetical protein